MISIAGNLHRLYERGESEQVVDANLHRANPVTRDQALSESTGPLFRGCESSLTV